VDEVDAGGNDRPGRQDARAKLKRLLEDAVAHRQGRTQPQDLLDDGIEVGTVHALLPDLAAQALISFEVAEEMLEGPGQGRGRRLVAGQQQGHELIAQLSVFESRAFLVACLEEKGEDVSARLELGI
jgi:hypothetical protein